MHWPPKQMVRQPFNIILYKHFWWCREMPMRDWEVKKNTKLYYNMTSITLKKEKKEKRLEGNTPNIIHECRTDWRPKEEPWPASQTRSSRDSHVWIRDGRLNRCLQDNFIHCHFRKRKSRAKAKDVKKSNMLHHRCGSWPDLHDLSETSSHWMEDAF